MQTASASRLASCVLLLCALRLGPTAASQEKIPLRILALLPSHGSGNDADGLRSTVVTAVRDVNERRGVLDEYELQVDAADGGCGDTTISVAYFSFVRQVFGSRRNETPGEVVGVVGPFCQESALAIANLSARPQIAIISINLASYSMDTNPRDFSFSMLSPVTDLLATLVTLIRHTGWRRVYVLYETNSLFYDQLYRKFLVSVEGIVSETEVLGVSNDMLTISNALSAIQSSGYRVIFLLTGEQVASRVLCLSSPNRLTFPNYQFVLVGASSVSGIQDGMRKDQNICHFGFHGAILVYHKTSSDIHADYTSDTEAISSAAFLGPLLYDSVWALALALNSSIKTLKRRGLSLSNYRYGMPVISKIVEEELFQLKFQGVSGKIDFRTEDGFSRRSIEVRQVVLGEEEREVLLAEYVYGNFTLSTSNTSWEIIDDSFPTVTPAIHIAWSSVFFTILFLHLTVLIAVHVALVVYRNQSWVKASSNRMNQFNIVGNYLIFLGLFLHGSIQTLNEQLSLRATEIICQTIWPWVLSIGSTLIIGSLALKTWRLYRIFFHYLNPGRTISDTILSLILLLLVSVDAFIASIWTATDPLTARVLSETMTDRNGRILIQQSIMCDSDNIQTWLVLIMLYKILQIGALLTLTILTRKINNKKYTTLNLRIMSYTLSFTVGFGITLFYFLFFTASETIADDVVLNVVLNLVVLQNILLVLLPPILPVLKEKFKTSGIHSFCS